MRVRVLLAVVFVLVLLSSYRLSIKEHVALAGFSSETAPRTTEEEQNIRVYQKANQATVFITTITLTLDPFDVFEVKPRRGWGSGIIIDAEKGTILTNLHVIQDVQSSEQISIMLANAQSYGAKLVGYDEDYDIAILRLINPPAQLSSLSFGDSSKLEVGQRVLAIGSPFGLDRTLTSGIISNLNRTVKSPSGSLMKGLIQTDAAINPGNSGGPLLDTSGRLIGVTSAILSQSGDSAGIGFAVPINQVARILPELIATGKVLKPEMGWVLVDTLAHGPMVRRVMEGGPAAKAGIQPIERAVESVFLKGFVQDIDRADLIYKVNGRRVTNRQEVEEIIAQSDPKRGIDLTLRRGGDPKQERDIHVNPIWQ